MNQGTHVLLVDDNPVIRELLLQALSPLASVQACASALDALRWAEKQTPDLIIADYRMPVQSGLELLTKLRINFPEAAVIMLGSRADIAGPLAGSSHLVEEFIEKPFFLEEATTRITRVLNRISLGKVTRAASDSSSVRGTLSQMSVVDLLQTLDIGRKTCSLTLTQDGERCELQFHDGQLVHASMGSLVGEEAVYRVVGWTEGAFVIDFERVECPRTITHSTQSVLLEALRRFDEHQRDSDELDSTPKPMQGAGFPGLAASAMGF
jgi:DNA-binding response OmpR family regulator